MNALVKRLLELVNPRTTNSRRHHAMERVISRFHLEGECHDKSLS